METKNRKKIEIFLKIAKKLNEIGIIPTLYGSLGLFRIIGDFKECEDIDVLVPENSLKKISDLMEKIGFATKNKEKNIYEKDGEEISFQKEEDENGIIHAESLKTTELEGAKFKELSLDLYLSFYERMLLDDERKKRKDNQDQEKIDMIKNFLSKNKISKEQEYLEGWKRCQADFENFKKRQSEQQMEMIKYANQNLILDIIPVIDNFHASTDHIPEDQKENPWVVGIMHIQKQLEKVLSDNGVSEIKTEIGDNFNPAVHEAVQADTKETNINTKETHKIKKVVLKGYKIGDKVIRAVRVIVE